jgi:hypothetical protein
MVLLMSDLIFRVLRRASLQATHEGYLNASTQHAFAAAFYAGFMLIGNRRAT